MYAARKVASSLLACQNGRMKTKTAIKKAKGIAALAKLFTEHKHPCTRQAVQQWGENLPPLREYQLREIKPEWFQSARIAR